MERGKDKGSLKGMLLMGLTKVLGGGLTQARNGSVYSHRIYIIASADHCVLAYSRLNVTPIVLSFTAP